ncbi:helix-turn-helix transcriptional regulator [uncultured Phenylobacterium sp.]|uniref:helix-turn-helix domain-containing protein n=1 Tax=uncultured Phenylobacterium sp. TaxID=349273 RepID=UPI0025D914FF|nr:helix-turn-helix transcriptional regulator [uncultured Phenylobacterium sp.]
MAEHVEVWVGRRLRRRRRLLGMTQMELGGACGVSFQQIQKYESASSRLSVAMLWKLACALGVPASYFFADLPQRQGAEDVDPPPAHPRRANAT